MVEVHNLIVVHDNGPYQSDVRQLDTLASHTHTLTAGLPYWTQLQTP